MFIWSTPDRNTFCVFILFSYHTMDDESTTIVARGDLNETLNRLEARVHGLSKLIEALI